MNNQFRAAALGVVLLTAGCVTMPAERSTVGDYLAGRFAAGENDVAAAARFYDAAAKARPGEDDLKREAFLYALAAGDVDAAARQAAVLADDKETGGLARTVLSASAIKNGALASAKAALKDETEEPFTRTISYLMRAWIDKGLEGPDKAIADLSSGPDDLFKGFNPTFIAILEEEKGDINSARAAYAVWLQAHSGPSFGDPVGQSSYGAFLERNGTAEEAKAYYAILAQSPGAMRSAAEAALARVEEGRPSAEYLNVSPAEGSALAFYLFAGNILQQTAGERQRAAAAGFNVGAPEYTLPLALGQLAVYLDPDNSGARRLVGSILNIYGDHTAARRALDPIPPTSPDYEQSRIDISTSLAAEKHVGEAISYLERAVRADPDAQEARLTLANMYMREGRSDEAIVTMTTAIGRLSQTPEEGDWRYFVTRAAAQIELNRWPGAEKDLKRAVEIAPEEPVALNYLGYSWAERGENLDEAFKLIEKAVELAPESGAITDSLGWAHYQRGDYEEARVSLEKAAALEPADPTITDHLGDAYWRLGRKKEARFQWERALELNPTETLKKSLMNKIENGPDAAAPKTQRSEDEKAGAPAPTKTSK
ncbi:MAG: tetratricopeptide repeat protein [Parvularculaceae bacterium]